MHVDINLLGTFSVAVDGRAVAADAWSRRERRLAGEAAGPRPDASCTASRSSTSCGPTCSRSRRCRGCTRRRTTPGRALGIPSAVVLAGDVVALLPDADVVVDVEQFDRASEDPSAVQEAIDLYRGDLLPEDLYEPWADAERERLRVSYLELLRSAGRWADLVAAEPLDEEAHLRLVQQHVESGSRSQALRQLDAMARLWRDELGTEPGPAARALHARAQAMPPVDPASLAPGAGAGATRVPRPATPTLGRDRDVAAVLSLLEDHRLVTLLGIGGVGKTRLAAEVAYGYREATSKRTCYVDLTKVTDAGLVAELTRGELGIRSGDNSNVVQMLRGGPAAPGNAAGPGQLRARGRGRGPRGPDAPVVRRPPGAGDQPGTAARRGRARVRSAPPRRRERPTGPTASPTPSPSSTRWRPRSTPTSSWPTTWRTSPRSAVPWTACPSRSRSPGATCAPCLPPSCASG